jgi:hypothetical protein
LGFYFTPFAPVKIKLASQNPTGMRIVNQDALSKRRNGIGMG